jgi:hypothetical protein
MRRNAPNLLPVQGFTPGFDPLDPLGCLVGSSLAFIRSSAETAEWCNCAVEAIARGCPSHSRPHYDTLCLVAPIPQGPAPSPRCRGRRCAYPMATGLNRSSGRWLASFVHDPMLLFNWIHLVLETDGQLPSRTALFLLQFRCSGLSQASRGCSGGVPTRSARRLHPRSANSSLSLKIHTGRAWKSDGPPSCFVMAA